jgi:hypothetical protein
MTLSSARRFAGAAALAAALGVASAWAAPTSSDLLPARPASRMVAVTTLSGGGALNVPCLTPVVQSVRSDPQSATVAARRSVAGLAVDLGLVGERRAADLDGNVVRFTTDRGSFDRIDIADDNGNGRPDVVDAALSGLSRAQRLLVGQLELPNPGPVDVILGRLGAGVDSLSVPSSGRWTHTQIWLDPGAKSGATGVRRAAEHQYAHAVALAAGLDPAWGEAFASWAASALDGTADDRWIASVSHRLASSEAGLVATDLELASGNAAWFAFLQEAYGPTAVKLAVEELGRGGSDQAALDRAMRRATGASVDEAIRDYQLWSLLVGPRDDGRHFSFASKLAPPEFASVADALPVLSVQADPEVGPMGSASVLVRPGERSGGMTVRFEGDIAARWAADLLLVRTDGGMQRVAVSLDSDDSGEVTIPLQGVREAFLLVRNLDPEGRPARRYTWGAQWEPGYPVEIGGFTAEPNHGGGVVLAWDTGGERNLLGFNVLRSRSDDGPSIRVNPVWIPAVGDGTRPASYSFIDTTAERGIAYRYRIEAVTPEGLASRSEAVALSPAP